MEIIGSLCRRAIMFWMCKTAVGNVRAKPQPFTIVSSQTVRVDMAIDTGVR